MWCTSLVIFLVSMLAKMMPFLQDDQLCKFTCIIVYIQYIAQFVYSICCTLSVYTHENLIGPLLKLHDSLIESFLKTTALYVFRYFGTRAIILIILS